MVNQTVYRKDYKPYPFSVESVSLQFDLHDKFAIIINEMHIKRQSAGSLVLYGEELELLAIQLDDKPLDASQYAFSEQTLVLKECPDDFKLNITTRIHPQNNTELSGLYRSRNLFCTQCEAEGFRRITYYPDRPDVLSVFTTEISADKTSYPVLLSNGNLVDSGDIDGNRHWVRWHDPFKKAAHLFALVAGKLSCLKDKFVTASGKTVDLHMFVEPDNEDKCGHAMQSLKNAMTWDEVHYGREYDLDIFMIVAVRDFNMGAMENKGLNIFNDKYILAKPDTATDQDYADIEGVVAHEYFHNWTGNRVTPRDWFQLSLKEGLTVFRDQEFSRDMNSREVNRIMDVKILRTIQFPEDAGALAHPVRPESYQEINNFYTATVYNKGAEVIRMQETLVGKEGFRRGLDLYFERYDGQAVTIDDFVNAIEEANHIDLSQFKRWYSQAGTPEVTVTADYRDGTLKLTMRQYCRPTPECHEKQPFHIPIRFALFDNASQQLPLEHHVLQLTEREQHFEFKNLKGKPLVSLLRDFSAPIHLHYQQSTKELLDLLQIETDGYAKWHAAMQLSVQQLTDCYHGELNDWSLSNELISAFQQVLDDEQMDMALRAEILLPPGFEEVASQLNLVDVTQLELARDSYRQQLGLGIYLRLRDYYEQLWQAEDHAMHPQAYARRKLRNMCLWFMMKSNMQSSLDNCLEQFNRAETMTDQMASLALLVNCNDETVRDNALQSFYTQWQQEPLVIDKWFMLQATCELPGTLARVQHLLTHPDFSLKNPNNVRAVIGAFCQSNHRHFHAIDGSGYAFLSDMLLRIDPLNPQIAARLATPFSRWQRLNKTRQEMMQEQLLRVAAENISQDLREVVEKSMNKGT